VIVPVHVDVPFCHEQPDALSHVVDIVYVLHRAGVPPQVPPTPESFGVHVQPTSCWHWLWLLTLVLVHVLHADGVPTQVPCVTSVQPWHSVFVPPHWLVGHDAQLV
jgi:hypothetical protein